MEIAERQITPPADVYTRIPADGARKIRTWLPLLKRSLVAARHSFEQVAEAELDRRLQFFGEETAVRRAYLRMLAHTHEHMGQMVAYLRFNGIAAPWPDWRPDRRAMS
jgi:uncharacterized damage-inducible protein DinB